MVDATTAVAPETSPEVMDHQRRRVRRRLAIAAFCYLAVQGSFVTGTLLWSPERAQIASVFEGMSPLFIASDGMFVTVILGYMGVSLTEKMTTAAAAIK